MNSNVLNLYVTLNLFESLSQSVCLEFKLFFQLLNLILLMEIKAFITIFYVKMNKIDPDYVYILQKMLYYVSSNIHIDVF
jgi:hypothetical protein